MRRVERLFWIRLIGGLYKKSTKKGFADGMVTLSEKMNELIDKALMSGRAPLRWNVEDQALVRLDEETPQYLINDANGGVLAMGVPVSDEPPRPGYVVDLVTVEGLRYLK